MTKSVYKVTGHLVEFPPGFPNKAVLEFEHEEHSGRVILWSSKLYINGQTLSHHESLKKYLRIGSKVTFSAHSYKNPNNENCGWFATSACCADTDVRDMEILGIHSLGLVGGIREQTGVVLNVSKRQAIVIYTRNNVDEKVLVLKKNFYKYTKKLNSNTGLSSILRADDEVKFDAVPFEDEGDEEIKWMTTAAWIGYRPLLMYNELPYQLPKYSCLETYKFELNNPYAKFLRGQGKILKILTNEYGVLLSPVKENSWQTILFHRTSVYLFGWNLNFYDLEKVFLPGDRVRFLAVPTALDSLTQWVARQVFVDTTNVDFNFNFD